MRPPICPLVVLAPFTIAAAALAQARVEPGLAAKYPRDRGIERHGAVIFASGFEQGFRGWTKHNPKVSVVVRDPKSAHGGSCFLQTTATRGKDTGGDVTFRLPGPVDAAAAVATLHLRFYCRFHKDTVMPHHFVKIRAIRKGFWPNAGRKPPGNKAFWTGIEPTKKQTWHFYTYWHGMRSWQNVDGTPKNPPHGDGRSFYGNTFNPDGQQPFKRGEWICVEAMMKANTPGKPDGEMAFWINGRKQGHWKPGAPTGTWIRDRFVTSGPYNKRPRPFEGFNFRTDKSVRINAVALQWYVSDRVARNARTDKNIVCFDDVVVATDYIGPRLDKR